MIAQGAPSFVALSACQTGRTELAIPEQASSIANVFIGHGAHCVLSTLWNVNDVVARDFGVEFVHRWMTGTSAGEAYASTLRALASRLAGDPDASQTLDAFQLIGERDLPWPVASSVANPQTETA
jgi:CHAT domain-containing protein